MTRNLHAYEMVEDTSPDEASLMKQQRRIEEAQRLRREKQATQVAARQQQTARPDAADRPTT